MVTPLRAHPTVLIIFGATGDVVAKKIVPAIFRLFSAGKLPPLFRVIGFSRRAIPDAEFQGYVGELLHKHAELNATDEQIAAFSALFSYTQGDFDKGDDYRSLAKMLGQVDGEWKTCANKLFYLAVPPDRYEPIFDHIAEAGLDKDCGEEGGWTRILVEKPIGMDSATAEKLDTRLGELFKEEQIYRIEHYLAKEMIRNLLVFRFGNDLFEDIWDRTFIEGIHIRLWEAIGVESRGNFYDKVGTLRDVGQNHLLQMLALLTMERPEAFTADAIRRRRSELLAALRPIKPEQMATQSFRAQYDGYQQIEGVAPGSQTETFFALTSSLDLPRWKGVPFTLEAGKRLGKARKEIEILLRHPTPCLCPAGEHHRNRLMITLEPSEGISIELWSKKPGHGWETEKRSLDFVLRDASKRVQYTEEYEKVLLDAVNGDQTLFIDTNELRAMWRFIDPIQQAWQKGDLPLANYAPDTDTAATAAQTLFAGTDTHTEKRIGIVGLGKMGAGLARNLHEHGWQVTGYNRSFDATQALAADGISPAKTLQDLVAALPMPRVVWLMVPAGKPVDDVLFGAGGLSDLLQTGDVIIDGGNSLYTDDAPRAAKLAEKGIGYIDAGVSGGPYGARHGACIMIGGTQEAYARLEPLFRDASLPDGYRFFEGVGAGHFVKMVHNGIEYGMMQAMAEGFHILKASPFNLDLSAVSELYDTGSVIESRLTGWLTKAYAKHGQDLQGVSGTVAHTGEGAWTVEAAKRLEVAAANIEQSLQFRKDSGAHPDYTGQVLSALREQFGGHAIDTKPE